MFTVIFIFFGFILHAILQVSGKRNPLPRIIKEEDMKPPIFGSYSYDPVKRVFVPPPQDEKTEVAMAAFNTTQLIDDRNNDINKSSVLFNWLTTTQFTDHRKHVSDESTVKPTLWWLRPRNSTNASPKMRSF